MITGSGFTSKHTFYTYPLQQNMLQTPPNLNSFKSKGVLDASHCNKIKTGGCEQGERWFCVSMS